MYLCVCKNLCKLTMRWTRSNNYNSNEYTLCPGVFFFLFLAVSGLRFVTCDLCWIMQDPSSWHVDRLSSCGIQAQQLQPVGSVAP